MCNSVKGAKEFWNTDNLVAGTLILTNLPKNNDLSLVFSAEADSTQPENRNTILKILSTFQFLN